MTPERDRSIRNVPVSPHRRGHATRFAVEEYENEGTPSRPPSRRRGRRGRTLFLIGGIVIVVCIIGGILLSTLFAGASVTVYPRTAAVPETLSIPAEPNPPAGVVPYQIMTMTSNGTTSLAASGTQKVSRAASGSITIYNTFSAESQRLVANTRFEAPDGKIYRIHDSVVVPGATMGDGSATAPGSVVATVYADSPGTSYNRGETRFTIPGFKGDPRYEKFYAEAQSIAGGFVGDEPAVAAADLSSTREEMRTRLQEAVRTSLLSQLPEGFVAVEGSFKYVLSELRQTPDSGNRALISQGITATAAIVRISDIATAVTDAAGVEGYGGEAVAFINPSEVVVSVEDGEAPPGPITLVVSGMQRIVWQYDIEALKQALVGKKKETFESIVTSFRPSIVRAEAKVSPFWQSSFPSDPGKIAITEGAE